MAKSIFSKDSDLVSSILTQHHQGQPEQIEEGQGRENIRCIELVARQGICNE
jgi:hypothetical protein